MKNTNKNRVTTKMFGMFYENRNSLTGPLYGYVFNHNDPAVLHNESRAVKKKLQYRELVVK